MGSHRGKYIWSNKRVGIGHIATRLDRFLVNNDLLLQEFELKPRILPSTISGHKPINLYIMNSFNYNMLLFRFNPLWLNYMLSQDLYLCKAQDKSPKYV
jgi:hypothetical protein